jgi:hypothetical protein
MPCIPTNQTMCAPLLRVLGSMSNLQPGAFVPLTEDLIHQVIRTAGYDPHKLESYGDPNLGWRYEGRSKPPGFKRRVVIAYRILHLKRKIALTVKGKPGFWALTDAGVAEAQRLMIPAPTSKDFKTPLIRILAHDTRIESDVTVPVSNELIKRVIKEAGYDPENLGAYGAASQGWKYEGKVNPPGLKRQVVLAYKAMHRCSQPLTVQGLRGQWGLTLMGTQTARGLGCKPPQNATSRFLDRRLRQGGGKVYVHLKRALASRLRLSAANHKVEDHLHNCFERLIRRDALRSRIEAGTPIENHHLVSWAIRSGITDIRDEGTNPVTREIHGSRTERERSQEIELGDGKDPRIVRSAEGGGSLLDVVDDDSCFPTTAAVEDKLHFESIMGNLEGKLQKLHPKAGERYLGILKQRMSGDTVTEIATNESVSKFRASTLIANARDAGQRALKTQEA